MAKYNRLSPLQLSKLCLMVKAKKTEHCMTWMSVYVEEIFKK